MKKDICIFCCAKCSRQQEFATKNSFPTELALKYFIVVHFLY